MEQTRKEQLSIYYFLKDLLPSFVNVKDEFPTEELVLPTVSIIRNDKVARPFQLGGDDLDKNYWTIDVFAQNSGQREDYLDLIHDALESGVCVYNYNEGFPPDVSPTQIGSLVVEARKQHVIRVYEELVKKKYWRGAETFTTYFTPS